ncbi:hypothetical protein HD553DRAFT_303802 [Filobasidium floriforme]|uniref:uncharacterized protein n=1 Tax=Filobasidium floriforme TaxID=5210 RepID=UPI001E8DAA4B|nr:uncharacterized protein HD553DRAFT_303802 [Filobasidium floriforme]KAH8090960.1 hypothetical protein HD553DRAFT_303802 [Filobasidium floriforme]
MDTILILQSMYPLPDEIILFPSTALALEDPTAYESDGNTGGKEELGLVLRVPLREEGGSGHAAGDGDDGMNGLAGDAGMGEDVKVGFKIIFPPTSTNRLGSSRKDRKDRNVKMTLSELPTGLIRADVDRLEKEFEDVQREVRRETGSEGNDDGDDGGEEEEDQLGFITTVIDLIRPKILSVLLLRQQETLLNLNLNSTSASSSSSQPDPDEPLERAYLWFPSLSTPSKRRDLVTYASRYHLTGFVLAGKPGLLCLEGRGRAFERYMSDIKNESWGDIPSYQKKVTERTRHQIPHRAFSIMQEITHLIDQRGVHGNRGDMRQVKEWMARYGLEDEFGFVMGM